MAHSVADIFDQAAAANLADPRRQGNVILIEPGCTVIAAGDIHGHRANLTKLINHAGLAANEDRRLIIQEVIHGPIDAATGHDRSIELLMRVARLKIAHPLQVVFLVGNHDIAQVTGNEITKQGFGVCKAFAAGAAAEFGEAAPEVLAALNDFLLSMPLAARCPNGVFLAHSLPAPARLKVAGTDILAGQGPFGPADIHHSGPVYEWTWGRGLTPEHLETLAGRLGAEYFILGHHHIDDGYEVVSPRGITINTDHHPAYFVEFASDAPLAVDTVPAGLRALHTV